MSHKATTWLGDIDPKRMTHGAFRVLFHLCDCHNPSQGCYPSQAYLAGKSGLARSGVNLVLGQLEADGLISRHQSVDPQTKKKRPTRYMLGFEKGFSPTQKCNGRAADPMADPCPDTGHGKTVNPCPDTGHGPVSTFPPDPCPLSGQSHVHRAGHKPVKEPVNETARAGRPAKNPMVIKAATAVVLEVRNGRQNAFHDAQPWVRDHIIAAKLLTDQERQALGISEKGAEHD